MPDLKPKPPAYTPGSKEVSASGLNEIRDAAPRQITGGAGNSAAKMGDRVIIKQNRDSRATPQIIAIMTVIQEYSWGLRCDRDGGEIFVLKPPKIFGTTGQFEVGEQIVACRVPSVRKVGFDNVKWMIMGAGAKGEKGDDGSDGDDAIYKAPSKEELPPLYNGAGFGQVTAGVGEGRMYWWNRNAERYESLVHFEVIE